MKTRTANRCLDNVRRFVVTAAVVGACGLANGVLADPPAPTAYKLFGAVRDFSPAGQDFVPGAADGLGYSVGNLASALGTNGLPVYVGGGSLVTTISKDSAQRAIAPKVIKAAPVTSFTVTGGSVTSTQNIAARVTVVGAAISAGGEYDCMVTSQVRMGSTVLSPFGSIDSAVGANVNNPSRTFTAVLANMLSPGEAISVDARSWLRKNASSASTQDADWNAYMTVNSASGGANVRALRNGDAVPNISGYMNQGSARSFVQPYIDSATNTIRLSSNQVIYLFEIGATSTTSSAFDLQDLVVLVELANDPAYFAPAASAPASTCMTFSDTPAVLGAGNGGGIASPYSFSQWFDGAPNVNMTELLALDLAVDSEGVYRYFTPDFHPIDGQMYGNTGAHNRGHTYTARGTFTVAACTGQFIEVESDGDAWLFIDGKLAIDMGGVHPGAMQRIDVDRLGLTNGAKVGFALFAAQRSSTAAAFGVRTNIRLESKVEMGRQPTAGIGD